MGMLERYTVIRTAPAHPMRDKDLASKNLRDFFDARHLPSMQLGHF